MLARRRLPPEFEAWNRRWGAPFGRRLGRSLRRRAPGLVRRLPQLIGPFGFQDNSSTRRWEYPWANQAIAPRDGQEIVEIGGSTSGFQFVLDRQGASVTNVDPGEDAAGLGWPVTAARIDRLNRAFGTAVRLVPSTLQEAALAPGSVDTVISISTIEHIPTDELPTLVEEIGRILRPGGRLVLTVDLFLDLAPFTSRTRNRWGTNVDVATLVAPLGGELVIGRPEELLGYDEFDPEQILVNLPDYLIGSGFPNLAQCLVVERSDPASADGDAAPDATR